MAHEGSESTRDNFGKLNHQNQDTYQETRKDLN